MTNLIVGSDKIHEDNFNAYHSAKDDLLVSEARKSFSKGLKVVLSVIGDIRDQKKAKMIFNEYNSFLKEKTDFANQAIKSNHILIKKLVKLKKISVLQCIIMLCLTIYLILKGF